MVLGLALGAVWGGCDMETYYCRDVGPMGGELTCMCKAPEVPCSSPIGCLQECAP